MKSYNAFLSGIATNAIDSERTDQVRVFPCYAPRPNSDCCSSGLHLSPIGAVMVVLLDDVKDPHSVQNVASLRVAATNMSQ
jgi:hypothetical protein